MIKTTFHFTEEQNAEFRRLADKQGRPFSQVIRGALDEWLLAMKEGKTIVESISKQVSETGVTVWVKWDDGRGEDERHFNGATAEEEEETLVVRSEKGKVLARYNLEHVYSWETW
jgi:hypothetical protein